MSVDELIALGTADDGPLAEVDPAGALHRRDGAVLRWWVLAEDRMHRPEQEVAVRRRLVGHAPVVVTALRVPGGDVEATAFAAVPTGGGAAATVVEVRNATAAPVVVAVVAEGPSSGWSLSRREAGAASAATLDDAAARVAGADAGVGTAEGGAIEVTWVPLPHSQTLRVVWADGVDPGGYPPAERVAAGWARQVDRGASISAEDPALTEGWEVDRRRLVLGGADTASATALRLGALVRLGWFEEAVVATDALARHRRSDGSFDDGAGDRLLTTVDALEALSTWSRAGLPADRLEEIAGWVADAARWLTRSRRRRELVRVAAARPALAAAAVLLAVAAQPAAAERARSDASSLPDAGPPDEPVGASARIAALVDGLLRPVAAGGVLEVLTGFEPRWIGHSMEVADVPTPVGRCAWALRWHGERPALLWEVDPWPEGTAEVPELVAPVLDARWRGSGWRGEALLAPVAAPGGWT